MSARIDIILVILAHVQREASAAPTRESVRDARILAFRRVAEERQCDQRSVIDTYREQLRPYVEGTPAFDGLLLDWLSGRGEALRRILLDRSDREDAARVTRFFAAGAEPGGGDSHVGAITAGKPLSASVGQPSIQAPDDADSTVVAEHTPVAADIAEPPETIRVLVSSYRILRDTPAARLLKMLYNDVCQVCRQTIALDGNLRYSEAHHIRPLGTPHLGPDIRSNMLVLCPNDHARLDLGALRLDRRELFVHPDHQLGSEFMDYHNDIIYQK